MINYKEGEYKEIRELDPKTDELEKYFLIKGIQVGISEVEHALTFIVTLCTDCKREDQYNLDDVQDGDFRKLIPSKKCKSCGAKVVNIQESKERIRKIVIQESGIINPQTMTVFLFGDHVNFVEAGKELRLKGRLRSELIKGNIFRRLFDASEVSCKSEKSLLPNEEELVLIKSYTKKDWIDSFGPTIKNMVIIKEALLLAAIGGVEREGVRGDFNILLVGDPGVAKTKLLKFLVSIVQKSDYVSGKSASTAGLLAGVDNLADGTRIAKAGPIVLCSGGLVAIDEMDKMNPLDRSALHESMETQKFSLRKIGINQTWDAKTVIVGAANPKESRWNVDLTIKENVKLPESLLSRFALMFLVRDVPEKTNDMEIARHIMKARMGMLDTGIKPDLFIKFINHCKTINPTVTEQASELLMSWWADLRSQEQKDGAVTIGIRELEDLGRIAESYARLRLSDTVDECDSKDAIKLLHESLQTMGMNTPGQRDKSIVTYMNRDDYVRYVFAKPITYSQALAELLKKHNYFATRELAEKEIDLLINKYNLISQSGNILTWVN